MTIQNKKNGGKIGGFLKAKRIEKGLTLAEMGDLTGISGSYLNRIEQNQRKTISIKILKKISQVLDISIEELLEFY